MGVESSDAIGSVRLTLGRATTKDEIDAAADALIESWQSLV
jgi:cysteine sulfinate desulfinase/cysteine desulfurase-like protein